MNSVPHDFHDFGGIATLDHQVVLHGDNGAMLKATTVLVMLHWLGVKPSY